ncbi:phage baseplate assembly protein V [Tamlana sp. 2_MG-2023]|uniref:type VI secretion system Vgr family protein n=1 Tax=unclassified Tamlana TaxID=2614803 RepID=UPI0026E1BBD2|nr:MULTISPECIES: phage baseplate assembly protein V [unclassified Tamlana]MDO6761538.1 phage baseplate assembly protein V [Tamlana sp. 2_MG-2023]MDO6792368.1 phage baseplate assembly protein V [Tamlana sp. 1_MG-2023]
MALQSITEIYIGNTAITSFKRFTLDQGVNEHHVLYLECRTDVLESIQGEVSSTTKKYLGETLTLKVSSFSEHSAYKTLEFKGVVTSVGNKRGKNSEHIVVIQALSPTVLCDHGPHYNSFLDHSLSDIISETLQGYDTSKLSLLINPENTATLHYTVQHKESNWTYVSRLAMQYSEWLYYDGKRLVFGTPEEGEDIILTYGHDLQGFSLDLVPLPNKFSYFSNDYLADENHKKKTTEVNTGANGYHGFVSERGDALYAKETSVWINGFDAPELKQRMDTQVEQQKKAVESKQVCLKGDSDNPGVGVGKIIDIKDETGSQGRYRVIKVNHSNNENGQYHNTFEALSVDIDVFPYTNLEATPKSDTQSGVVIENADPESLARVKVQFPWQKITGETTPWIRIVTPHGGSEKGFHFIPEIGEEVLVGFEGGNAERPYMLGSLYNGNKKPESWKTDANDIKAIRTRSGHTIELNDTDGAEKINIYDNEGSIITFDTQAKSLFISATENLEFQAKNIKMIAEENIELEAQGEIKTASEGDTSIVSQGDTNIQSESDTNLSSGANITIEATTNAVLKGQNITAESQVSTEIKGQQTKVQGQITALQGASGKVEII